MVFAILVAYQIFLPPVTGLANNSDFVYVLGKPVSYTHLTLPTNREV